MNTNTSVIAESVPDRQLDADEEKQRRNMEKLRNELGPVVCSALDDPDDV
jgi:hypothetical protein